MREMNSNSRTNLGAILTQLYKQRFNEQSPFNSMPLDEGVLLRIHTNEGLAQLFLVTSKIGVRKDRALILAKGHLFKPDGEFVQFRNLLAVPKDVPLEQIEVIEEAVIETRGVVVTPRGERLEFHDRNETFFADVDGDRKSKSGCRGCSERVDPHSLKVERRVRENRCWLCTGIALAVGTSVSILLAWMTQPVLELVGIGSFQTLIFVAGLLFTGWRAWYWGYLPFQDQVAHALRWDR